MSRKYRAPTKGGFYHVTNRGNNKEVLYRCRGDMQFFMKYLGKACLKSNVRIHSYCLMTNHYHLLVETPEANLSYAVMLFESVFAQYVNRRYERVGHVFQGRFDSQIIEEATYYLTVVRYIMQNPVRANLVSHPRAYEFCSYRMTLGFEKAPDWFAANYVIGEFAKEGHKNQRDGRAEFVRFVNERDYQNLWGEVKQGVYLGSDEFVAHHLPKARPKGVPKSQCRPPPMPLKELAKLYPKRDDFILAAHVEGGHKQVDIASFLSLDPSTVSRLLKQLMSAGLES